MKAVLVHGAWHGAWAWDKLLPELSRRGIDAGAVDLPGHGDSALRLGDMHGDAAHVAALVDAQDEPVCLVGHSYGGVVITQAASLSAGKSLMDLRGIPVRNNADLAAAIRPRGDGTLLLDPALAGAALYADCEPAEAAAAVARLGPQPGITFGQPVTSAAWKTVPTTYVVATQDRAILPEVQRAMARRSGGKVVELEASHSPFMSVPGKVADVIGEAVEAAKGK
ncbi:Alpha/beta hydrolase fold-1 [Hyaloraphidium curvatum]|nr:Alpha/beta hydrolase fold-1 [Hyaloraphidium curvatum]